jgi:hypothetical protein
LDQGLARNKNGTFFVFVYFLLLLLPRSRAQLFFSSPFLFSRSESFKADDDDSDKKGHSRQLFRSNTETGLPDGIFSNQKY